MVDIDLKISTETKFCRIGKIFSPTPLLIARYRGRQQWKISGDVGSRFTSTS